MRVFISSTVFDLIDIRAELAEQLRAIGITPVLSDDKLSDFRVQYDVISIETCLVNVDSCDEFLLILDQRYGPTLESYGYDKVSATHLEYLRAIEKEMPVRVYARDRLIADFAIWKRNGRTNDIKYSWVADKDVGLFKLLDEYAKPQADATRSNWYDPFTSSIDLKAAITKHFEKRILPKRLVEAIQNNVFPLFDIKVETTKHGENARVITANLTNISRVPAFNLNVYWESCEDEETFECSIFSPGRTLLMNHLWRDSNPVEKILVVEYESSISVSVCDRFCISSSIVGGGAILRGGMRVDRKFRRSAGVSLEIEDISGA